MNHPVITRTATTQLRVNSIANPSMTNNRWSFAFGFIVAGDYLFQLITATMTTIINIVSIDKVNIAQATGAI